MICKNLQLNIGFGQVLIVTRATAADTEASRRTQEKTCDTLGKRQAILVSDVRRGEASGFKPVHVKARWPPVTLSARSR